MERRSFMSHYADIPAEEELYPESWYSWPQSFTVPRGWNYRTDSDGTYRTAECEMSLDLYCAGDWLEIVNENTGEKIIYRIY